MSSRLQWIVLLGMLCGDDCLACFCSFQSVPNAVKKADLVFRGRLVNVAIH